MQKLIFIQLLAFTLLGALRAEYDPTVSGGNSFSQVLMEAYDDERNRMIPLRIFVPDSDNSPVILFSHGLGGSRMGNSYLGKHWSSHGYAVVYLQHAGSDESIWKDLPPEERAKSVRAAANARNAIDRFKDVSRVLDTLEQLNVDPESELFGKLDLSRIGMSGHSFGANTTQGVSGQRFNWGRNYTDERIDAAVAFSQNAPGTGRKATRAFQKVEIPWLVMTGTKDLARVGNATIETRLAVFPALPKGDKYELVLHDGEHHAFGEGGRGKERNPNHHRAILALSLAFWDSYLQDDLSAKEWIQGNGPASVLEEKDRWQAK